MPLGLDQLVAERATQSDIAVGGVLNMAASRPGLGDLRQQADIYLGIERGDRWRTVPQHRADAGKARTVAQHRGRSGMPKHVSTAMRTVDLRPVEGAPYRHFTAIRPTGLIGAVSVRNMRVVAIRGRPCLI